MARNFHTIINTNMAALRNLNVRVVIGYWCDGMRLCLNGNAAVNGLIVHPPGDAGS